MKPSDITDFKIYLTYNADDYYSQRNNQYDPNNTCNVTSMIKACSSMNKYELPDVYDEQGNKIMQPEDRLYYICNHNPQVLDYYKERYPDLYSDYINKTEGCYFPNEIHDVLSYATNLFLDMSEYNRKYKMGDKYTQFSTNVPLGLILFDIFSKKPVVMSGRFNGLNHVVTLIGYAINDKQIPMEERFIIQDPYGETYNYRNNHDGRQVWLTREQMVNDFKPLGNSSVKWAHRFC